MAFGPEHARFQIYFLDDNAFGRESDKSFWVRGDSRADLIVKTVDASTKLRTDVRERCRLESRSRCRPRDESTSVTLEPGQVSVVELQLPRGSRIREHARGM